MKNLKDQPDIKLLLEIIKSTQNLIKIIEEEILYKVKSPSIIHKSVYQIEIYEKLEFLFESIVHHVEAVIYIAMGAINSNNPLLVNSALAIIRVILETSARIYWLSEKSGNLSELFVRYKKVLTQDKESFQEYAKRYLGFEESHKKEIEENINILTKQIGDLDQEIKKLNNLNEGTKLPSPINLIENFSCFLKIEYNKEHNDILLYYMSTSKIVHGMSPVIYTLINESKTPVSDWNTAFKICFVILIECSNMLFNMRSISNDDFHEKLQSVKSRFFTVSETIEKTKKESM